ncbi:MAG: succinate dehydrogenase, hydrophobic membrane anchor protein [Acetobacteraceae bacterium]
MPNNMSAVMMRSALGRVRGLGTARSGLPDWWTQRVTAVALVPLGIWFVVSLLVHLGDTAQDMTHWAAIPWNTVLLLAFLFALFRHVGLGLKVIIEDYVHVVAVKVAGLLVMKAVVALLWIAATVSVLKLAFSG